VISVGAASGHPTTIDVEAERMTLKYRRIETFMTAFRRPGPAIRHPARRAAGSFEYRGWCHDFDAAIDALLGRRVAGKVALTVS
jgi:NADPH:quinone reductase